MSTKPVIVPIIVDDKTGQAFVQINEKLLQMKARASETMRSVHSETSEAQAAVRALGEEFGITIPRHLATLIARFEGLGSVIASVSGVAIAGLGIEVFAKASEKLSELADEMEGYGDAEKEAYKQTLDDNKKQIEYLSQIKDLQRQVALAGATSEAERTRLQAQFAADDLGYTKTLLQQKTDEWKAATAKITQLEQDQAQAAQMFTGAGAGYGIGGLTDQTRGFDQQLREATADAEKLRAQVQQLQQQAAKQGLVEKKSDIEAAHAAQTQADQDAADFLKMRLQMMADEAQKERDMLALVKQRGDEERAQAQQLTNVLSITSAAVKGPLDDLQKLHDQIRQTLEAERSEEQQVAAEAQASGESQLVINQKLAVLRAQTVKDLKEINAQYQQMAKLSADPTVIEEARKLGAQLDTLKAKAQSIGNVLMNDIKSQSRSAFEDMILQTKSVSQAFKQMAASIIADLVKMILEMYVFRAVAGIFGGLFGGSSGNGVVASLPGGGTSVGAIDMSGLAPRAAGGSVSPGTAYLVGENGPEMFMSGTAGSIIPNSAFGKGGNVYNIDARGSQAGVERDIMRAIKASEDRAVVRSVRSIDSRAKRRG